MHVIPSRGLSVTLVRLGVDDQAASRRPSSTPSRSSLMKKSFRYRPNRLICTSLTKRLSWNIIFWLLNIHFNDIHIQNWVWSWELKARANPPTGDPPWSTSNKSSDLLKVSASSQQQYTIQQSSSELPEPYHAVQSPNFRTLRKCKM